MTERTISKVLITQEDLALGQGAIAQTRQGISTTVNQIDLPWMLTSVTDIKQLDTTKYKHCILSVNNLVRFYEYDATSAEIADDITYIDPISGVGQWVLYQFGDLPNYIAAEFATVADLIAKTTLNNINNIDWVDYLGRNVTTVEDNTTSNDGGGAYTIVNVNPGNLSTLINGIWVGANHDLGGGFYAKLLTGPILYVSEFGWPGVTGIEASDSVNSALVYAKSKTGAEVICPSSTVDLAETIFVSTGSHLKGGGVVESFTVNKGSTAFDFDPGVSTTLPAIQLGEDGAPTSKNRGERVSGIRVTGTGRDYGIGFSTVDTDNVSNTQNTINWSIEWCTAFAVGVGFRHRNAWTAELIHNHAIQCGTGFLIDGAGAGGGTSTKYISCVSYQCDTGFHLESGWNYSGMDSCGADGCDIGLLFEMRSGRGSTIRNFGFERTGEAAGFTGDAYGVYMDDGGAGTGYLTMDGINFGIHSIHGSSMTFIHIENGGTAIFRGDFVVTSGILTDCTFFTQANQTCSVIFYDLVLFSDTPEQIGDLFSPNVTLINCVVNGISFRHAVSGFDEFPQTNTYSSGGDSTGQSTPNKPINSKEIFCDTNSDGSNRFLTSNGTDPTFDTSNLPDWAFVKFINATDTGTPAQIGFRSEDHTANTGIIRDSALSAGTTITLATPGDWVVFQKRPDGNLYQVEFVEVGV